MGDSLCAGGEGGGEGLSLSCIGKVFRSRSRGACELCDARSASGRDLVHSLLL